MERFRTLRIVIWLALAILIVQLVAFAAMLWPLSFFTGVSLAVILILCVYLVRISFALLGELEKGELEKREKQSK